MTARKIIILFLFSFIFSCACSNSYAGGEIGGKTETALTTKVDTNGLSGVNLWIAELYNNDRTLYAVIVTLIMASLGSIMALGTDLVLKYFGMNVSRISHSE